MRNVAADLYGPLFCRQRKELRKAPKGKRRTAALASTDGAFWFKTARVMEDLPWMKLYTGRIAVLIDGMPLEAAGAFLRLIVLTHQRGPLPVVTAEARLGRTLESFGPIFMEAVEVCAASCGMVIRIPEVEMHRGERIGKSKQAASAANARWSRDRMRTHESRDASRIAESNADGMPIEGEGEGDKRFPSEMVPSEHRGAALPPDSPPVQEIEFPPPEPSPPQGPPEAELRRSAAQAPAAGPPDPKPEYGDPRINACLKHLRDCTGVPLNGSRAQNRRFAKQLLDKFDGEYPGKDPVVLVRRTIDLAMKDPFHAKNAGGFIYLYRNVGSILLASKGEAVAAQAADEVPRGWLTKAPVP